MGDPFQLVRDFEEELCMYTGAPYAVTTTSCTDALKLAVAWHLVGKNKVRHPRTGEGFLYEPLEIEIPKRTYVGVPMSIIHAGGRPTFRDEDWLGWYQLKPLPVWDSARRFTSGMYVPGNFICVSFHWSKTLGIQQGGAILLDDAKADRWLRMARFDGRQQGVAPKDQKEWIIGHHCYMAPETAAAGIMRMSLLPRDNEPLPNSDYPDLSTLEVFK